MSTVSILAVILIGALASTAGLMWALGGKSFEITTTVTVNAPPERLFPHLVEPELVQGWIGGLVETRPLTDGGPGLGARSIDVIEERGRQIELVSEITAYQPPHRLEARIEGPGLETESRFDLEPTDGETTRLHYRQRIQARGLLRAFTPFLRPSIRERQLDDLSRLRRQFGAG